MAGFLLARARLLTEALWRGLLSRPPARRPIPGELVVPGLAGEVTLRRDEHGVPHIAADSLRDLGVGVGVAAAQDRLWQMELLRRFAAGRLAELLGNRPLGAARLHLPGPDLLAVDRLYRHLALGAAAREEWAGLAGESRALLAGFAEGVNAWLAGCRTRELPLECLLLGARPEPWRPEDSLAVGKLFGWFLSLAFPAKPVLAALAAHPELGWLLPPDRAERPAPRPGGPGGEAGELDLLARRALGLGGAGQGSNAWVLGGRRTASGKPLLCNDPHLALELPGIWHPLALSAPGLFAIGVTLPGVPLVLLGRTDHLGWGCTAVMADDGDYYRERLDAGGGRYRRDGEWRGVEEAEETFRVRGQRAARRERLRYVRHGGVRCPLLEAPGEEPVSFRWAGFEPGRGLEAFLGMNRARTVAEFLAALEQFAVPAQNVVVADRAGSMAYACAGKIPRRPGAAAGLILLEGERPEHAWRGYLGREELPAVVDPLDGILVTANHRPAAELPGSLATGFWEPPYRAVRIRACLEGCRGAGAGEMAALQADLLSLQAVRLLDRLVRPLGETLAAGPARRAAEALLGWDCRMEAASAPAALFHLFYQALLARCIRPPLEAAAPGLFARYLSTLHLAVPAVDRALATGHPACFPGGVAAGVAACLAAAWEEAERRMGADPAGWCWGRLHTLTLSHGLGRARSGPARLLSRLFRLNRGPFPWPGDGMTVNLGGFSLAEPFRVAIGPSYRQILDLGDPEASRWILAGGASGDPRSPHYADQVAAWRAGATRPMVLAGAAGGLAGSQIRLRPPGKAPGRDCAASSRVL